MQSTDIYTAQNSSPWSIAGRERAANRPALEHQDSSSLKHPHVLLCAYQCGPGLGSVSQIGWEWYRRLVQKTEVTLVTHVRNKKALSEAGAPFRNSIVHYIDTEWFAGPLYRLAKRLFPGSEHSANLIASLDFYVYDAVALRQLRRVASPGWEVVHVVTPVSPVAATRLYKLGTPSIVGPWNGGLETPSTFPELMRQDASWVYGIRVLGRAINRIFGTTHNATRILAATAATTRSLPMECRSRVRHLLENGVDLQLFRPNAARHPSRPGDTLRALFVGRLIPAKGIPLLLEAVQRVQAELPIHVTIVGGGSLLSSLQEVARCRGVEENVTFVGAR
jgi:glycosyltransferase involved in cell wall biosynthesis